MTETHPRPKFPADTGFHDEVKRRVNAYFVATGLRARDDPRMYAKSAVLLLWLGASWGLLVFAATTWWQAGLASLSLAFAMAGVGFGVQHDANHGAYSDRPAINRWLGLTLDLLGASSYVWHAKHNVSHHTYTNLVGADDDIDFQPFARLAPAQPHRRGHRLQQLYIWPLYGLLFPKWALIDDFKCVARGRIAGQPLPRPRGARLVELVAGKAVFFSWALVIPALIHPWWVVLTFFATTSLVLGATLAIVFQLAHCVEEAQFPVPQPETGRVPDSWAVHQLHTTIDFARGNRVLTWFVGGLNFQVEHHLFPRVCHLHYPRIAKIVEAVAGERGLRYRAHPTFRSALASHGRWLRRMGQASA